MYHPDRHSSSVLLTSRVRYSFCLTVLQSRLLPHGYKKTANNELRAAAIIGLPSLETFLLHTAIVHSALCMLTAAFTANSNLLSRHHL